MKFRGGVLLLENPEIEAAIRFSLKETNGLHYEIFLTPDTIAECTRTKPGEIGRYRPSRKVWNGQSELFKTLKNQ